MGMIVSYFTDFLANIRLPDSLNAELKVAHTELREYLRKDDITKNLLIDSFLQGSYARSTCIKPEVGQKVDVDVIAVTNIDHKKTTPQEAFNIVLPFVERYYNDFEQQKRSIGICLEKVDVDFVITAAPSEQVIEEIRKANLSSAFTLEDISTRGTALLEKGFSKNALQLFFADDGEKKWRKEPLLIPDNEENEWFRTHPLEQIRWTQEKNQNCNGHYVNVVKALKWWKRINMPRAKHPKSYPLEHFVGDCCPDGISSVAEGIVATMEKIVRNYPSKPKLPDRGVPEHDVFESLTDEEYEAFYQTACRTTPIARRAYDTDNVESSVLLWRQFFCNTEEFPEYHGSTSGGYTPRTEKTEAVPTGRFG